MNNSRATRPRRWLAAVATMVLPVVAACTSGGTQAHSSASPAAPATQASPATSVPSASPAPTATGTQADWLTYDRTAGRGGLSVTTPAPGHVRKAWTARVDGAVYAQPLIAGPTVIIATENDTVYALNAATGAVRWSRHLAAPVPSGLPCGNVDPSGITGTPVADTSSGRLWVVTFTAQPSYRHTLWALSLASGRIVSQRAIDLRGSDPKAQQQRGALALLGSRVYVPLGGLFGDCSDYKGRVVGAPVSGHGGLVSFTTDNERQAGIWAPAGEAVRDDSLYVATGNGMPYNQVADSDSVLRLSPALTVQSRFTPSNFEALSAGDQDLGSTAPALLPGGRVFEVGKEGVGYVLDGSRLGGTGGELASARVCEGGFGGDAVDGSTVVFSCFQSLRAVQITTGAQPRLGARWSVAGGNPGPPIIAGGVVWDVDRNGTLSGYRLSTGQRVFSTRDAAPTTSFPGLAASGTRLVVPAGTTVVSFTGA
ncbi:MAG TPA: PQQ-binding-like beta-propeller repeat protein [Streptosporangiaceae bacterium]|nr:PQQ-binding-like beta-propeller repeat protein [Streptosporangiaceae bacterium]